MSRTFRLARWRARARALTRWRMGLALFGLGAVSVLAHAPFHNQAALLIAYTLLVLALDGARRTNQPLRAAFFRGWAFGAGTFLAGFWWTVNAFLVNPEAHAWLAWTAVTILPAGLGLFWGAAGALYIAFAPRGPSRILTFTLAVTATELTRSIILSGFPWNLPGHIWPAGGAVSQIAAVIGASGLSMLTIFAFAAPAALFSRERPLLKRIPPAVAAALLVGLFAFGAYRLSQAETENLAGTRVRIVQTDVAQAEKTFEDRLAVLDRYLTLSAAPGLDQIDAVIWPEGAVPTRLLDDFEALERIGRVFADGPRLIAGTVRVEGAPGARRYFNSLVVLDFPGGRPRLLAVYDKSKLVPFGESNPLAPLTRLIGVEGLSTVIPDLFSPGTGAMTLELEDLPAFAPLICYEVIYPRYALRGEARPDWLLNISNDAWFGDSTGPRQHFNLARYRALEAGLPMIRATSGGVSGVVDSYGRRVQVLEIAENALIDTMLLEAFPGTAYSRYGNLMIGCALALLLLLVNSLLSFAAYGKKRSDLKSLSV